MHGTYYVEVPTAAPLKSEVGQLDVTWVPRVSALR